MNTDATDGHGQQAFMGHGLVRMQRMDTDRFGSAAVEGRIEERMKREHTDAHGCNGWTRTTGVHGSRIGTDATDGHGSVRLRCG